MSQLTQNLRAWADELASGKWQSNPSVFVFGNDACVKGVGIALFGHLQPGDVQDVLDGLNHEQALFDAVRVRAGAGMGITGIERAIVEETLRITSGAHDHPYVLWRERRSGVDIDTLHICGVDFPTFARAIRTVARKIEEQGSGAPIVVSETAEATVLA